MVMSVRTAEVVRGFGLYPRKKMDRPENVPYTESPVYSVNAGYISEGIVDSPAENNDTNGDDRCIVHVLSGNGKNRRQRENYTNK